MLAGIDALTCDLGMGRGRRRDDAGANRVVLENGVEVPVLGGTMLPGSMPGGTISPVDN